MQRIHSVTAGDDFSAFHFRRFAVNFPLGIGPFIHSRFRNNTPIHPWLLAAGLSHFHSVGKIYHPSPATIFTSMTTRPTGFSIWRLLATVACVCLGGAIWCRSLSSFDRHEPAWPWSLDHPIDQRAQHLPRDRAMVLRHGLWGTTKTQKKTHTFTHDDLPQLPKQELAGRYAEGWRW